MNRQHVYQEHLKGLGRTRPALPYRLIAIVVVGALFAVLWAVIPQVTLFWVLLPVILVITWLASFGWRTGLKTLGQFINRLERL